MIDTGADLNQFFVAIEMDQVAVQGVFADSNALRFQVDLEFVDTEGSRRAAEQLAHQPTQHEGLGSRVMLEYLTQQNDMDRALVWPCPRTQATAVLLQFSYSRAGESSRPFGQHKAPISTNRSLKKFSSRSASISVPWRCNKLVPSKIPSLLSEKTSAT